MIKVFPTLAPAYFPVGPISLAKDLDSLAEILGDALVDHLNFGFIFVGLSPQDLYSLLDSATLLVRHHSGFDLITGSVLEWRQAFEAHLTKESNLRVPLCQVFFVMETTVARRILKKYDKVSLPDTSFTIM
jgi:hypothetical protein